MAESSGVAIPNDEVKAETQSHVLGKDLVMGFRRLKKPHTETGTSDWHQMISSFDRRLKRLRSMPSLRGPSEDDTDQADKPPSLF